MNQSQSLAITCNSLEARKKSRVSGANGFGFDSHWLKNWRESFKPIAKRSNRNHGITFDSHLKTALSSSAPDSTLCCQPTYKAHTVVAVVKGIDGNKVRTHQRQNHSVYDNDQRSDI